jgi:hypothetical protein
MSEVSYFGEDGFKSIKFNGNLTPITHSKLELGEHYRYTHPPTPFEGNLPPDYKGKNKSPKSYKHQLPESKTGSKKPKNWYN